MKYNTPALAFFFLQQTLLINKTRFFYVVIEVLGQLCIQRTNYNNLCCCGLEKI